MKKLITAIIVTSIFIITCKNPADINQKNSLYGSWVIVNKTEINPWIVPDKIDTIGINLLSEIADKQCEEKHAGTSNGIYSSEDTANVLVFITFNKDTMIFYRFSADPSADTLYSGCCSTDSNYYFITNDNLSIFTHGIRAYNNPLPYPYEISDSIIDTLNYHYQISGDSLILTPAQKNGDLLPESLWYVRYYGKIPPTN